MQDSSMNAVSGLMVGEPPPASSSEQEMAKLRGMIEKPEPDSLEICREISLQISRLSLELVSLQKDPILRGTWRLKGDQEAINDLLELHQSVTDMELLRHKREILNIEGEAVGVLLKRVHGRFVQAMADEGFWPYDPNNVMRQYRHIAEMCEPLMRKEIAKINRTSRRRLTTAVGSGPQLVPE